MDWTAEHESLATIFKGLSDTSQSLISLPRTKVFEAFLLLCSTNFETNDLLRLLEEGSQLCLKRWNGLPTIVTNSHLPLLAMFQQFVELQEASNIYLSASSGTNVPHKVMSVQELKGTLGTWRDRLPNLWDDISIWSELVAWRQHVFCVINTAYQHLDNQQPQGNSLAFRGFHEIAWIINRYAHVARKQHLIDACMTALQRIYTLPNIEIHDAFLKLREQAKCFENGDISQGLDVINNTNLGYFQALQRAEFFALKGKFLSKMGLHEEANHAFSTSIQIDAQLAHGWASWGSYNDELFREKRDSIWAANAVNCYLNASGLFKNAKCRKYVSRILWLLANDFDGNVFKSFELYKGEIPVWYWISFIPQLISALSRKEAKHAKHILIRIAKQYPQSLYFELRTCKEEILNEDVEMSDIVLGTDDGNTSNDLKTPGAHVEDIMSILKSAYPLLTLSMETLVDQILARLKPTPEQEVFNVMLFLLEKYYSENLREEKKCLPILESAIQKCVYKDEILKDFSTDNNILIKLRKWKDMMETLLQTRPKVHQLPTISQYLAEFEHQKFDDVEVPGQYLELNDSNTDFIRIDRIYSEVEIIKIGMYYRRIEFFGHDGSRHIFLIQNSFGKHLRMEERMSQLFRLLNGTLGKQKESRKRGLAFNIPPIVPLSTTARLIADHISNLSLFDIYERSLGYPQMREPVIKYCSFYDELVKDKTPTEYEINNFKLEVFLEVSKLIPKDILSKFMLKSMNTWSDLWIIRKQFTYNYSCCAFLSYIMGIGDRTTPKIRISFETGGVFMSDLTPSIIDGYVFGHKECVPFRLTPNIQHFITPTGIDGLFIGSLVALGNCLDSHIPDYINFFILDQLMFCNGKTKVDTSLLEQVETNTKNIMERLHIMSCKNEKWMGKTSELPENMEQTQNPVYQGVTKLINEATDPRNLSRMSLVWFPWV